MENADEGALTLSHLLFVDDIFIFCDADLAQIQALWVVLCFDIVSSLKVNLEKSEITPVGVVSNISCLTNLLGCKIAALPKKYLGLPLVAFSKAKSTWLGVWHGDMTLSSVFLAVYCLAINQMHLF